jgi:hypothetical protein
LKKTGSLTSLEVLAERADNSSDGRRKTAQTKAVEQINDLRRKVLEKTGSLASLKVLAEGGNDASDWGSEPTKTQWCEESNDFRREIFEKTRSLTLLNVFAEGGNNTSNWRGETAQAKAVEQINDLWRQILKKALTLLDIDAESADNATDRGRKAAETKRGKQCNDLRREVLEKTGSSDRATGGWGNRRVCGNAGGGDALSNRSSHGGEGHWGDGEGSRESHFEWWRRCCGDWMFEWGVDCDEEKVVGEKSWSFYICLEASFNTHV